MQINGEKGAIFWCKVYGVKCMKTAAGLPAAVCGE